ncbi:MAG: peptide chain release factor N(5)-glutamine methyltransferase [Armatimonadaceae bacterium]
MLTRQQAVREATVRLENAGIAREDAGQEGRLLTLFALNLSRESLFLAPETSLTAAEVQAWNTVVVRREQREPLAYIVGEREFYGLRFRVTPAVLIPRPETELLVETALAHVTDRIAPRLVDVGTGSGCIGVAISVHRPDATVLATDLSVEALAVATENVAQNRASVEFCHGDLLEPVGKEPGFHAIISNPPYIAPDEIARLQPEVRDWEPPLALGTHPDPLHFYRRLAVEAPPYLAPGGMLAVEVGQGQAAAVRALFAQAGFQNVRSLPDLAGIERVVAGTFSEI